MPDPIIPYAALRAGGACVEGIRSRFPALRAAGIKIPRRYSTLAIPLSEILRASGFGAAIDMIWYAEIEEPWIRLLACDCSEHALLRERVAGREPDPRSWRAIEVSRAFARGEATADELEKAWVKALHEVAEAYYMIMPSSQYAASAAAHSADREPSFAALHAAMMAVKAYDQPSQEAVHAWLSRRLHLYLAEAEIPPVEAP